jgi:trans-aconitate methyltransferase
MADGQRPREAGARHWDAAYASRGTHAASWYQPEPLVSLELIAALGVEPRAAVIDVGGGASFLVDRLRARGFDDLTVLDVSGSALDAVRARVGDAPVRLLHKNLLDWAPDRIYDIWHDRAVFHFLVDGGERRVYVEPT